MKTILPICLLFLFGCSPKMLSVVTGGIVPQKDFTQSLNFDYHDRHMFVDVVIKGQAYNFLFDTGWDVTSIDKRLLDSLDFEPVAKGRVSGSSVESHRTEFGFVPALTLADITIRDSGVGIEDLSFVKATNSAGKPADGILGANVFRKMFWQIDYQQKKITFSDGWENLAPEPDAIAIPMIPKTPKNWGANKVEIMLDSTAAQFIFDTGANGSLIGNKALLTTLQIPQSSSGTVSVGKAKLGSIDLGKIDIKIDPKAKLLLGNELLENYLLTVDWKNDMLYLDPR